MDMSILDTQLCTQRGSNVLEYDNRLFRPINKPYQNSDGSTSVYYKCRNSRCKGRLTARSSVNQDIEYYHDASTHSCSIDPSKIILEKAVVKCSKLVAHGKKRGFAAAAGAVVSELIPIIGPESAAQFNCSSTGRRAANREYSKHMGHPPTTYEALTTIPEEFTLTKKGDPFLLVFESFIEEDSGLNCGPILIFATKDDLMALFEASVIAADGTFRIKPKPFAAHRSSQVFTLNSFFGVENSRRLYRRALILMPKRTKVSIIL